MTINLSDNSPRISYTVASGVTHTNPFDVPFEFFEEDDLNVYVDGTLKTITTDYTVTGGSGSTGSITMTVVGASGNSTVVITRNISLERTTDFPTSGPFDVATLNTELDRFTAQLADQKDQNDRSVSLSDDDATVSMTLPLKANRVGRTLAFNASTGAVEAGPSVAGVTTVSALSADIATLADIEDGTTATDAISGLAAIKTHVTGVSNIATAVSAVNSNAININAVNSNSSNIDICAGKASEITSVAAKASLLTSDFVNDLNTLAVTDVIDDINLLAASDIVSDINLLATSDIVSDLNQLATSDIITDINLLADSDVITDLNLLGTSDFVSDLNLLADRSTDIGLLADIEDGTVATNAIQTVAANISGITSFAEIYRSGATDPTTNLDEGDLFYNSSSNALKFYDGNSWQTIQTFNTGISTGDLFSAAANVADDDFLRVAGTAIEGRSAAEVASDIGAALLTGATFSGAVAVDNQLDIEEVHEKVTVITSTSGTLTFDTSVQGVVLGTANQTANRTINFSNVNSTLAIGQSVTCAVMLTQGSTAYYLNAYQVDSSSVTPKWQGGTAPTAGNASGIDVYSFTIIKTADATFTVLASQTAFA